MTNNLDQKIAQLREEIKLWQESYNNKPDGCNATALHDLNHALEIIDELQDKLRTIQAETSAERYCFQHWKSEKATLKNMNKSLEGALEIVQAELSEVKAENTKFKEGMKTLDTELIECEEEFVSKYYVVQKLRKITKEKNV